MLPIDGGHSPRNRDSGPQHAPKRFGRRKTDVALRQLPTKKFVALVTLIVNLLVVAGDVLTHYPHGC
jgi:hypothetical protein